MLLNHHPQNIHESFPTLQNFIIEKKEKIALSIWNYSIKHWSNLRLEMFDDAEIKKNLSLTFL